MALLAILFGLAIAGFAIFCLVLYWMLMIALIGIGVLFLFWFYLFTYFFTDPSIALPCAVIATGLAIWAFVAYTNKSDKKNASGNS